MTQPSFPHPPPSFPSSLPSQHLPSISPPYLPSDTSHPFLTFDKKTPKALSTTSKPPSSSMDKFTINKQEPLQTKTELSKRQHDTSSLTKRSIQSNTKKNFFTATPYPKAETNSLFVTKEIQPEQQQQQLHRKSKPHGQVKVNAHKEEYDVSCNSSCNNNNNKDESCFCGESGDANCTMKGDGGNCNGNASGNSGEQGGLGDGMNAHAVQINNNNNEHQKEEFNIHAINNNINNNCNSNCYTIDEKNINTGSDANNKLTSSSTQGATKVNDTANSIHHNHNNIKESYLDLLIASANSLISKGLNINTLKELKKTHNTTNTNKQHHNTTNNNNHSTKTANTIMSLSNSHTSKHSSSSTNNNNTNHHHYSSSSSSNSFSWKCENKICPVIVNKKNNIYQAKINSLKNKILCLCSLCYQAWKNGQYCYYCGIIYRQYRGTKGFNEHKTWIGCDYCKNWEHVQCEEQKGYYTNLSQLIKKNKHLKYKCPVCRSKTDKDVGNGNNNNNNCVGSNKGNKGSGEVSKEGDEKGMLQHKRKMDNSTGNTGVTTSSNKRRIKKRKKFEDYDVKDNNGSNVYTHYQSKRNNNHNGNNSGNNGNNCNHNSNSNHSNSSLRNCNSTNNNNNNNSNSHSHHYYTTHHSNSNNCSNHSYNHSHNGNYLSHSYKNGIYEDIETIMKLVKEDNNNNNNNTTPLSSTNNK